MTQTPTTKPQKLPWSILHAVRGRLGVEDFENDSSRDKYIYNLPPERIVELYVGWHLGDEAWARNILDVARAAGVKFQ